MNPTTTPDTTADRRAAIINYVAILGFFASYLAARLLLRQEFVSKPLRVLLCLLPALIGGFALWRIVKFVRDISDELERRVQLEAFAFAFPAGLLSSMALGFLEWSRLLNVDPWDYWFFHIPMYLVGLLLARKRYQ